MDTLEEKSNQAEDLELNSDYGKKMGVKGLFHSDELPKYGITQEEVNSIKTELQLKENYAFILIADTETIAKKAITVVKNRASQLELLKEVRNANEDGTSSFSRPMPGSSRMYPETDIPLIDCPNLEEIKLPELIPDTIKRYKKEYDLNDDLATIWAKETTFNLDKIIKENNTNAKIATRIFIEAPAQIKKMEKIEIKFNNNLIKELFKKLIPKNNSKQAIETALIDFNKKGKIDYSKFETIDNSKVDEFVKKIIKEMPDKRPNVYMGLVMKEFKGKVNGKDAMILINKCLK
jgi:glutamyl-tRNA(Gln) amidotransferase subunit E